MEVHKILLLDDDYPARVDVKCARADILDLSSDEDIPSAKIKKATTWDGFNDSDVQIKGGPLKRKAIDLAMADVHVLLDAKKPMKQESTDLTGSDSGLGSDDDASSAYQNIFMSRNNDRTLSACSTTASAIDVTHLFDFSEEDFVPGPAYMDEDEDSDATNWDVPGIFHSPLHSPLPRTPNCSEKYSLRPRPRPSENNAPSYSEPPAKRCKRANKENHGNGEENPGWREAYNMLLKEYTHLQREYDMLKESVEMERRVEQGQGQGLSRSPSHLTYVTNRGVSLLGGTGHTNQQSYVSNVYSLLS